MRDESESVREREREKEGDEEEEGKIEGKSISEGPLCVHVDVCSASICPVSRLRLGHFYGMIHFPREM